MSARLARNLKPEASHCAKQPREKSLPTKKMSNEIIQLRADDFEETIDFLNLVFGMREPDGFEKFLPVRYRATDEDMAHNFAVKRNGRIRAIVGLFPSVWQFGDVCFRVAGIGGVSTHPKSRGEGLMHKLMTHCLDEIGRQGYHVSRLGGQRQRYAKYGYEKCGMQYSFTLARANFKYDGESERTVQFEPLMHNDDALIRQAKALHDAQPIYCYRSLVDFQAYGLHWYHVPHVALDPEDRNK